MPAINFSVNYRKHCVADTTSKLGAAKLSQSKQRATSNATSKSNFTVAYAIIAIIIASILIVLVYAYYTTRRRLTTNIGGIGGGGGGTASTTAKNKLTKYESLSSSNNSKNNKVSSINTHNHHHQYYQRAIVKSAEYCRDDGEGDGGGGDGDDEYCGKAMRAKIMNGDGNVGGRGGFTKNVNGKKASRSSKQQQYLANKQDDCQQINETSNIYETG